MTASRRSARWQGILAAAVTFLVTVLPTAAIVYGARAGSIGSVSMSWFGPIAALVLAGIAVVAGNLVTQAYRNDPDRRPGDIWSTWFSGFTVLVVGSWFVPFLVLFVFVDSDRALSDRMFPVMVVWSVGHILAAALANRVARGLRS